MKKGSHCDLETRARMSAATRGSRNAMFGRKHSPESLAKMRIAQNRPDVKEKEGAANRGKKRSPETRAKMRAAHLGKKRAPLSAEHRAKISLSKLGERNPNFRKTPSADTRTKMSLASFGRKHSPETRAKMTGARHWAWRGGAGRRGYTQSFTPDLKKEIRVRDGYNCRLCGISETETKKTHTVHHMDYNKANDDPVNLLTLCRSCHGHTNTNRDHWMAAFQEVMIWDTIARIAMAPNGVDRLCAEGGQ